MRNTRRSRPLLVAVSRERLTPADVGALQRELARVIEERDERAREVLRLEGERQRLAGDLAFACRVITIRTAQVASLAAFRDMALDLAECAPRFGSGQG